MRILRISIRKNTVAPFTGAWIEIESAKDLVSYLGDVAPFTGAWIEIDQNDIAVAVIRVAPFTGAWIEIHSNKKYGCTVSRRALHGRVD